MEITEEKRAFQAERKQEVFEKVLPQTVILKA